MDERQQEMLNSIREKAGALSSRQIEYWKEYSSFNDWELWAVILILIVPLILLYFKIDQSKILLLGFYGLNFHIWFAYTNSIGIRLGLWEYPYELLPVLPSFALDASFVPVMYILLYQWTLNHQKNFYFYHKAYFGQLRFFQNVQWGELFPLVLMLYCIFPRL
jgi:hypothetical protein